MPLLRRLLRIDLREVTLERRGFSAKSEAAGERLEKIGASFVGGYHAALTERWPEALATRLQEVEHEFRGFAYEGSAMALYLLDHLSPWRESHWQRFLDGPARTHMYMVHVGAGWVFGRLPIDPVKAIARMDPLLRWLAIDGYAFHQAYFRPQQAVYGGLIEPNLTGYARRAWDLGIGRALWFVEGIDVKRIATRINTFSPQRRGDLWSGAGLACAYAGGVEESEIQTLLDSTGQHRSQFAQGVVFAAKARQLAGSVATHTELACRVVWNVTVAEAAGISDEELSRARNEEGVPAFEDWRRRIQLRAPNSEQKRKRKVEMSVA